eukprot:365850-Chlamydomonas_euryale.AAC.1
MGPATGVLGLPQVRRTGPATGIVGLSTYVCAEPVDGCDPHWRRPAALQNLLLRLPRSPSNLGR